MYEGSLYVGKDSQHLALNLQYVITAAVRICCQAVCQTSSLLNWLDESCMTHHQLRFSWQ